MPPSKAFVLAAGYGKRLRPYTDTLPKPMVTVCGEPLIDRTLDALDRAGVKDVAVNTHYLAPVLAGHLRARLRPAVTLSHEDILLDTGGGILNMIDYFNGEDFYVLGGDGYWIDDAQDPALPALAAAWDPSVMDILIMLQPVRSMKLTRGVGDYHLLQDGRAVRALDKGGDYMFTGMRINRSSIFDGYDKNSVFSYLALLDRAQQQGRLFSIVHKGDWHHISTPGDLEAVELDCKRTKTQANESAA